MRQVFRHKPSGAPLVNFFQLELPLRDPGCEMSDAGQIVASGLCRVALVLKARTECRDVRVQDAIFQPRSCLSRNDDNFTFHDDLLGVRTTHTRRPLELCADRTDGKT